MTLDFAVIWSWRGGLLVWCVNPPRTVRDPAIDIMAGATFERHLLNLRPTRDGEGVR